MGFGLAIFFSAFGVNAPLDQPKPSVIAVNSSMKVSFEVTVLFVMSRKFQLVEAGGRSGEVVLHHVNIQLVSGKHIPSYPELQ